MGKISLYTLTKPLEKYYNKSGGFNMKNKLLKKTAYLITAVGLGSTLLLGNAYSKQDNPTEITVTAYDEEHNKAIITNKPLQLSVGETLKLNITAYDEDGIESHYAFVESKKFPTVEIYSNSTGKKCDGEKSSSIDANIFWYTRDKVQVKIIVKDKQGNTAKKTLDVYFD